MKVWGAVLLALFVLWASLLLIRNRPYPRQEQTPDEFMAMMADEAVKAAKEEFQTELDYSFESVRKVEEILSRLHLYYLREPSQKGMKGWAITFGAYIGEVLRRFKGQGQWQQDHPVGGEKSWPLMLDGDHAVFVYGWAGRRIQDGPEDNVWHKFQSTATPGSVSWD